MAESDSKSVLQTFFHEKADLGRLGRDLGGTWIIGLYMTLIIVHRHKTYIHLHYTSELLHADWSECDREEKTTLFHEIGLHEIKKESRVTTLFFVGNPARPLVSPH